MMNKILPILIFTGQLCFAQINAIMDDIVVKHSGDSLKVNVLSVDDKVVFKYLNENASNFLSKNCIEKIIFGSGRIQKFDDKVVINDAKDWDKVVITTNTDDVKCLVRKGEVRASSSNDWNFKGKMGIDKKATMKIKKEAAKLKAHVILLEDQYKKNMTFWSGATSSKYGIAYSYE